MERVYSQISRAERCAISRLQGEGCSARQIAARPDPPLYPPILVTPSPSTTRASACVPSPSAPSACNW